jgi:hypothetical protein
MNKMTLAMYIRLSDEDADLAKNDLKLESNSVSNQRNFTATYFFFARYSIISFMHKNK